MMTKIKYLRNSDINREKWDHCIDNAVNGIIYAYSWYLDIVAENWDALIMEDYKYVMPLPAKRKMMIHYVPRPNHCQQLGVFPSPPNEKIIKDFLLAIPRKFKIVDYCFNIFNQPGFPDKFIFKKNVTYQLDLILPYDELFLNFSTNTKRSIRKAQKNNISIIQGVSMSEFIKLKEKYTKGDIPPWHYTQLQQIMIHTLQKGNGMILGAYTAENNLCAAAFFVRSHNTAIYLSAFSTEEGLEKRAMFLLVSHFLKKNSGHALTLDFEGSNIKSVAHFYKGFGATSSTYYEVRRNTLPYPFQWLKQKQP